MNIICWLFGCKRVGQKQERIAEDHVKTTYYLAPFCKRCGKVFKEVVK